MYWYFENRHQSRLLVGCKKFPCPYRDIQGQRADMYPFEIENFERRMKFWIFQGMKDSTERPVFLLLYDDL